MQAMECLGVLRSAWPGSFGEGLNVGRGRGGGTRNAPMPRQPRGNIDTVLPLQAQAPEALKDLPGFEVTAQLRERLSRKTWSLPSLWRTSLRRKKVS